MSKSLAVVLCLVGLGAGCWTESKPAAPAPKRVMPIKAIVQPVKIEKQPVAEYEDEGEEGGVEGGEVGGVVGGYVGAPPPPPPPPPPRAPMNVAPTLLEGTRIAGDKLIAPDDDTKVEITKSGKDRIVASFKLCLADDGKIVQVSLLKSSGFPAYDQKIMTTIRTTWGYRPYLVNGQPQPVCTAVTFIYAQH
jgi:protein TonB